MWEAQPSPGGLKGHWWHLGSLFSHCLGHRVRKYFHRMSWVCNVCLEYVKHCGGAGQRGLKNARVCEGKPEPWASRELAWSGQKQDLKELAASHFMLLLASLSDVDQREQGPEAEGQLCSPRPPALGREEERGSGRLLWQLLWACVRTIREAEGVPHVPVALAKEHLLLGRCS